MKKIIPLLLSTVLLFSMAACGSSLSTESEPSSSEEGPASSVSESGAQAEEPASSAKPESTGSAETPDTSESVSALEITRQDPSSTGEAASGGTPKALVVYFSATGNTKAVAEALAELQGADLYEIVPEQLYTGEDLNYNDPSTRASAEQNDEAARPAIVGGIDNIEDYDVLYVGFPIWWGDMPRILNTFFDAYDLSGKVIAPFCTSGGSGISTAVQTISALEPAATVTEGLRAGSTTAEDDLSRWLSIIGMEE